MAAGNRERNRRARHRTRRRRPIAPVDRGREAARRIGAMGRQKWRPRCCSPAPRAPSPRSAPPGRQIRYWRRCLRSRWRSRGIVRQGRVDSVVPVRRVGGVPATLKVAPEPDTVPGVVVPSPQSIVAVKSPAALPVLASVKVATTALLIAGGAAADRRAMRRQHLVLGHGDASVSTTCACPRCG